VKFVKRQCCQKSHDTYDTENKVMSSRPFTEEVPKALYEKGGKKNVKATNRFEFFESVCAIEIRI
jgi:hypothetical protein